MRKYNMVCNGVVEGRAFFNCKCRILKDCPGSVPVEFKEYVGGHCFFCEGNVAKEGHCLWVNREKLSPFVESLRPESSRTKSPVKEGL